MSQIHYPINYKIMRQHDKKCKIQYTQPSHQSTISPVKEMVSSKMAANFCV